MASIVIVHNNGGFDSSFSVQWNGGQTGRSPILQTSNSYEFDLDSLNIPSGVSCWMRAYIQGGPNHDSGDNFTYTPSSGTVIYTISGTTLNPSWSSNGGGTLVGSGKASEHQKQHKHAVSSIPVSRGTDVGSSNDTTYSKAVFSNNAAFCGNFSVQWNGGETNRTEDICAGGTTNAMDLTFYKSLPEGTSCWARVYVDGGVNHDSGRNFTYSASSPNTVYYNVTGGCDSPSFN